MTGDNSLVTLLNHSLVKEQFRKGRVGFPNIEGQILGLSGKTKMDCAIGHIGWAVQNILAADSGQQEVRDLYVGLQTEYHGCFASSIEPSGELEKKNPGYKARNGF